MLYPQENNQHRKESIMTLRSLSRIGLLLFAITSWSAGLAGAATLNFSGTNTPSAYEVFFSEDEGNITPIAVTTPAGPWVKGPWITYNNPDQSWPMDSNSGNLPGTYYYNTKFDLGNLNPETAVIKGAWASDNGSILKFNGVEISSLVSEGFGRLTEFTITEGFLPGENFLTFEVTNDYYGEEPGINPTGLLVNVYEATAVPEPSTVLLLAGGLIGVCFMRRKER